MPSVLFRKTLRAASNSIEALDLTSVEMRGWLPPFQFNRDSSRFAQSVGSGSNWVELRNGWDLNQSSLEPAGTSIGRD